VVAYEPIIAACGHPEQFGLFEDRKDRFRSDRRKKAMSRPCKACREKRRLEIEAENAARKEEKQRRAEAAAKEGTQRRTTQPPPERLPDGSRFDVVYHADREEWTGTLTIGPTVFTASASAVFKLLNRLDKLYRASLPENQHPV
jgi:hypothetical protein